MEANVHITCREATIIRYNKNFLCYPWSLPCARSLNSNNYLYRAKSVNAHNPKLQIFNLKTTYKKI